MERQPIFNFIAYSTNNLTSSIEEKNDQPHFAKERKQSNELATEANEQESERREF